MNDPFFKPPAVAVRFAPCAVGESFDLEVLTPRAIDTGKIYISHEEFARRVATVDFRPGFDFSDLEACHIWTLVDGVAKHQFYGEIKKSVKARAGRLRQAQFLSKHEDDIQLQANLLNAVRANPVLYVPEIEEASDALDAGVILAATSEQMEFDLLGVPHLCSVFGDPNRLTVIDGKDVSLEPFDYDDDDPPPSGVGGTITFEGVQRRFNEYDVTSIVQAEIDRIARDFYGIATVYGGNATMTPDFVDGWPEPGSTLGSSYVVRYSTLVATDGPGAKPPSSPVRAGFRAPIPREQVVGIPENLADDNGDDTYSTELGLTGFSAPFLVMDGVQAMPRREVVSFFIPFQGQEMVRGNGEPEFRNWSVSGLDEDKTVEQWQANEAVGAGERRSAHGMVFQSTTNQLTKVGLLADMYDRDIWSVTNGRKLWEPVVADNSPLGSSDVSKFATSAYGRRIIQHCIRRAIVVLAGRVRCVKTIVKAPVHITRELDPRSTVRVVAPLIQGGFVEGKVKRIEWMFDPSNGVSSSNIELVSAIGSGSTQPPEEGEGEFEDLPVLTQGGDWDLVRYSILPYIEKPMTEAVVTARVNWLGCEQKFALENPGVFVPDPYSEVLGPNGENPVRNKFFPPGALLEDFLEECSTDIQLDVDSGENDSPKPQPVYINVTFGWRGPKQIELI